MSGLSAAWIVGVLAATLAKHPRLPAPRCARQTRSSPPGPRCASHTDTTPRLLLCITRLHHSPSTSCAPHTSTSRSLLLRAARTCTPGLPLLGPSSCTNSLTCTTTRWPSLVRAASTCGKREGGGGLCENCVCRGAEEGPLLLVWSARASCTCQLQGATGAAHVCARRPQQSRLLWAVKGLTPGQQGRAA